MSCDSQLFIFAFETYFHVFCSLRVFQTLRQICILISFVFNQDDAAGNLSKFVQLTCPLDSRLTALLSCLFPWFILGSLSVLLEIRLPVCYRSFPCGCGIVASHFFSGSLKVLSQGNPRMRSLQAPRSVNDWLTYKHNT